MKNWTGVLLIFAIVAGCGEDSEPANTVACRAEAEACEIPPLNGPNPCCAPESGQDQTIQCLGSGTCTKCGLTGAACGGANDGPCCRDLICNGSYGCQPY